LATPETAAAIADAGSLAFLVGGYDGSGNFGDLAQLDAATALLGRLKDPPLLVPVLALAAAEDHARSSQDLLRPPEAVVFHDSGGVRDTRLVPVPAAMEASFAACYLYGGGYLNRSWGPQKLEMLRAAEETLRAAGASRIARLSSGLQVDPAWLRGAPGEDRALLRLFEPLGGRDHSSVQALGGLAGAEAVATGDDAVALLRNLPRPPVRVESERLRINVHFGPHNWVTQHPEMLLARLIDLLAALGRAIGLPVVVRPLIAYLDRRVDERRAAAELSTACMARGLEVEAPIVLRPAELEAAGAEMRRARLSVTCSYHAALTSLMLGIPTLPVRDTAYYEQKTAGLLEDFAMPRDLALRSSEDPERLAKRATEELLGPDGSPCRERLEAAGGRLRVRRESAEELLLTRLEAAQRGRPVTPAFLAERRDGERRIAAVADRARERERRASAVEGDLARLRSSCSWRLTAPLRTVSERVRERRA
jgi:polysaccharide pyruvyl transferase WcaK-like protein